MKKVRRIPRFAKGKLYFFVDFQNSDGRKTREFHVSAFHKECGFEELIDFRAKWNIRNIYTHQKNDGYFLNNFYANEVLPKERFE